MRKAYKNGGFCRVRVGLRVEKLMRVDHFAIVLPTSTMEGSLEQVLEHPKSPDFKDAAASGFTYDTRWPQLSPVPLHRSIQHAFHPSQLSMLKPLASLMTHAGLDYLQ